MSILEESLKEIDPTFDQELYQKILWKLEKRKQRGKFKGDCRLEAFQEYQEAIKNLKSSQTELEPKTVQISLNSIHKEDQTHPIDDIGLRMAKQDLAEDSPRRGKGV